MKLDRRKKDRQDNRNKDNQNNKLKFKLSLQ